MGRQDVAVGSPITWVKRPEEATLPTTELPSPDAFSHIDLDRFFVSTWTSTALRLALRVSSEALSEAYEWKVPTHYMPKTKSGVKRVAPTCSSTFGCVLATLSHQL